MIARWAYFEVDFDECLDLFLLSHPNSKEFCSRIPPPFKKRIRLFRDLIELCFVDNSAKWVSPSLTYGDLVA
jgi:hypothetical protein